MTKSSQLALINGDALTGEDVLSAIDGVIDDLNSTGDLGKATHVLTVLEKIEDVSSHAKAKLLYGMNLWWIENKPDEVFKDYIESHSEKTKAVTVDRYITAQSYIESGDIPDDVAQLPMRNLVPIAKTLSHGHKISRTQYDNIIKANNSREIEDILRSIKNKEPRKSSLQIEWSRDGSLYAWKDNKRTFLGWLDKEAYAGNDVAQKAINRILDNTGIIRK